MKTLSFTGIAIYPQKELTNRVYFPPQHILIDSNVLIIRKLFELLES